VSPLELARLVDAYVKVRAIVEMDPDGFPSTSPGRVEANRAFAAAQSNALLRIMARTSGVRTSPERRAVCPRVSMQTSRIEWPRKSSLNR
jgi:hypothetical protein